MGPAASPARAAREAFAARLRGIREDAALTGRDLAALAGWHASKVSKIEHAVRAPSADDVRAWVAHCGASDQLPDLLAVLQAVEGMYVEFRGRERTGFRHIQADGLALYERVLRSVRWDALAGDFALRFREVPQPRTAWPVNHQG